jgi:hypothetical protein
MKRQQTVVAFGLLVAVSIGAGAVARAAETPTRLRLAATYSASGTHQCQAAGGATHSCVVTGTLYSNCIDATSSLRVQDCCPSTQVCDGNAKGDNSNCRRGGTSSGFALNYCIPGGF